MSRLDLIVVSIGLGTGTPNLELGDMALKQGKKYKFLHTHEQLLWIVID